MKKTLITLLMTLVVLILAKPAVTLADVVWEPYGDDFYDKHSSEMQHEERYYIANSPEGYVYIYDTPGKLGKNPKFLLNGEKKYIYFTTEYKGQKWGISEERNSESGEWTYQWLPLDECYAAFNSAEFLNVNSDKMINTEKKVEFKKSYVYWEYPGAETCSMLFDCEEAYSSTQYVDDDGNEWYYFGYVMGMRDFWVNMSDPEKETCTKYETPKPDVVYEAKEPSTEENNKKTDIIEVVDDTKDGRSGTIIIISLLSVAVCVCAIAITRKINGKQGEQE